MVATDVSIRKSLWAGMLTGRRRLAAGGGAAVVMAGVASAGRRRLRPRVQVSGTGFPGQEPSSSCPAKGFPAVAGRTRPGMGSGRSARSARPSGSDGDGPERGGQPGGVLVPRAVGVLPAMTGPRIARSAVLLSRPVIG
jgi:hypothetical protein